MMTSAEVLSYIASMEGYQFWLLIPVALCAGVLAYSRFSKASGGIIPMLFEEATAVTNAALGQYQVNKPSDDSSIAREPRRFSLSPVWRKQGSLLLLIVQNSGCIIAMRASRVVKPGKLMYISTTAVVCAEIMKLCASFCLLMKEKGSFREAVKTLRPHLTVSRENLMLLVPGLLYALQNNLLFISLSNLSGAMHQVSYQLKILSTAMLSVLILHRSVSRTQWLALLGLTIGVMLIQVPHGEHGADSVAGGSTVIGLAAILGACVTSGLAGVTTERLMKKSEASIWVRNIQLAIIGSVMGLVAAYAHDGAQIQAGGFLQGYDALAWSVVIINALGGIIISMVMKYADNILKCFASALSIILTCFISFLMGEFTPSVMFMLGTSLVIASSSIYGGVPKASSFAYLAYRLQMCHSMARRAFIPRFMQKKRQSPKSEFPQHYCV